MKEFGTIFVIWYNARFSKLAKAARGPEISQVAHDLWISTGEGSIAFSSNRYSTSEEFFGAFVYLVYR